MIPIALLVIGILGFVKRRINVTGKRELRGSGMYIVATLFCLPLPMSFLVGFIYGTMQASGGKKIDPDVVLMLSGIFVWAPFILAMILAFVLAKPKLAPAPQGLEVKM
jgi:hypothetical protein